MVVDAFRASTKIAVLVRKGVRVVLVASIEEAAEYAGPNCSVGERGSAKVWGSFWELADRDPSGGTAPGATVVLSTTNGTRIIEAAQGAFAILAGAFVNAHAVADKLAIGAYGERVAVIGCGWEGRRASEDESAAGAILYRLRQRGVGLDERAHWVVDLYLARPRIILPRNSAARRLARLGHGRDIDFCPAENTVPVVPRLEGDILWAGSGGVLAGGPNGGGAKRPKYSPRIFLTRAWRAITLKLGTADRMLQASPNRRGEEVLTMTITITHERVKEVTREDVDRAIDVIERHLEKEARTRNLLDEQAIMRPKDLCKQQGLDMVAELRGMV